MKKTLYIGILIILFGVIVAPLYFYYETIIHNKIEKVKKEISLSKAKILIYNKIETVSRMPAIKDEPNAWYMKYKIIAHGGGGVDGIEITNSQEALNYNYGKGTRLFDVDICWTKDSTLVLCHSWLDNFGQSKQTPIWQSKRVYSKKIQQDGLELDSPMVLDSTSYADLLLYGMFHTLSVHDFLIWMEEHFDVFALPDFKSHDMAIAFIDQIKREKKDSLFSRIVFRIDKLSDYEKVKDLPVKDIMLKLNNIRDNSYADIIRFCTSNNIHAVSLSLIESDDIALRYFKDKGIHVYVTVVDNLSDYNYFKEKGAWGAVSNFLNENKLFNEQCVLNLHQ